jgi:hypothetical protein
MRGVEKTVMIRVYVSERDLYNGWCVKKGCDMPELHKKMARYGIQKRDQLFYDSLPSVNKFKPCIRRKESRIKRNSIQFKVASNV